MPNQYATSEAGRRLGLWAAQLQMASTHRPDSSQALMAWLLQVSTLQAQ
jgi:hypothetical protein